MRTYNMSKRRQQERDHPLQLYPGIQGAGRLRGANGSQKHQQSLLALPTEARSHLEWKAQAIEGAAKAFPWKHRAILPEHGWLHRSKHFMITVSFIIPVANEEKRLEKTFTALQTVRVPHGIRLTEVIFVNDGSTDLTASMIKEFGKHNKRVRLISYTQNQGKGYAVRQGMLAATGDYALFFDADMSTSLSQIKKFVPYMENHTDVIIGTRKNGKSTVISRQPWYREVIGKCFTKLTQFLLQVDVTDF